MQTCSTVTVKGMDNKGPYQNLGKVSVMMQVCFSPARIFAPPIPKPSYHPTFRAQLPEYVVPYVVLPVWEITPRLYLPGFIATMVPVSEPSNRPGFAAVLPYVITSKSLAVAAPPPALFTWSITLTKAGESPLFVAPTLVELDGGEDEDAGDGEDEGEDAGDGEDEGEDAGDGEDEGEDAGDGAGVGDGW
jgi:hypothetical protein